MSSIILPAAIIPICVLVRFLLSVPKRLDEERLHSSAWVATDPTRFVSFPHYGTETRGISLRRPPQPPAGMCLDHRVDVIIVYRDTFWDN